LTYKRNFSLPLFSIACVVLYQISHVPTIYLDSAQRDFG
jgi:hypothetical protein